MTLRMNDEAGAVNEYRRLPSVDSLLKDPVVQSLAARYGGEAVEQATRTALARARAGIAQGRAAPPEDAWPAHVRIALDAAIAPSLHPVINATGVILHTNLGRAPLSEAALQAVAEVAHGYSNLEYNLEEGARGSRHDHARSLIASLTGAEDSLVVNNNAAAVLLTLSAFCAGRQVLISRSQLVEIGGGFRIPDVLRQSGAELVEVGTTNRTHLRDFEAAIGDQTAAILHVHSSNFRQVGFVAMPTVGELAHLAHAPRPDGRPLLLIEDLGSGALLPTDAYGLQTEPMPQASIQAGADLVTMSGDKLLGGPQAGIIVGRREMVDRLRAHPLARAVRVDKMALAALEATLRAYLSHRAVEEIPIWQMIAASAEALLARATRWQQSLRASGVEAVLWPGESAIGGGSLPGETLPTTLLAIPVAEPDQCARALRMGAPAVVCRVQKDHLLLDPRTVLPGEDATLVAALMAALSGHSLPATLP